MQIRQSKMDDIIDAVVLSLSAMRWEMNGKRQITQEKKKTHSNYRLTSNTKWKKSTSYFQINFLKLLL